MTRFPARRYGTIDAAAAATKRISATFFRASTGVGTAIRNMSASQGVAWARRLARTFGSAMIACRSTSLMCRTPSLIALMMFSLMSTPTTVQPARASSSAAGRPTYPVPSTTTVLGGASVMEVDLALPLDRAFDADLEWYRRPEVEVALRP